MEPTADRSESPSLAAIAVLGASGLTGRAVTAELARRDHRVVAAAPDPDRLRTVLDQEGLADSGIEVRAAAAGSPGSLDDLLGDVDLVIALAAPYLEYGQAVLDAALRAGVHYLDAALEPPFVARVHSQDARARRAGCVLVSAGGFPGALLDLLAGSAVGAVTGPDGVHLATTFPSRGGVRAGAGATTRAVLADLLAQPMETLVDGELVSEPVGEARRLAWFPRPVGLAHAAGVPGSGHLSVPRHAPQVPTVREYLALSGWKAEVLQLAGNATRWAGPRRTLHRVVAGGAPPTSPATGDRVRWACVAETRGDEGVARAWANGRNPVDTTGAALAVLAEAVLADPCAGVRAPAELAPPHELLDRLSARRELRWSLIRPG